MSKNHTEVTVDKLPKCSICKEDASYDAKIRGMSSWGYLCEKHFKTMGSGLGLGKGQKLILKKEKK